MPRLRRYLPPLLILLPMMFICGKILLTPIYVKMVVGHGYGQGPFIESRPERGWPWLYQQAVFQERPDVYYELVWPSCQTSNWGFSLWLLLADIVVLCIPVVLAAILLVWWRKRSGGWLRFSVRGLFVWVAIAAIGCGWWANHARQRRQEQAVLKEWDTSIYSSSDTSTAPHWLQRLAPNQVVDAFNHIVSVDVALKPSGEESEVHLPQKFISTIPRLPHLRALNVYYDVEHSFQDPAPALRFSHEELKSVEGLIVLDLSWHAADDETLRQIAQLPRLRALKIYDCQISDQGLDALRSCLTLEAISLRSCTQVTDAGIDALLEKPGLTRLDIMDCEKLSSKAVRREKEFPGLTVLHDLFDPEELESSK